MNECHWLKTILTHDKLANFLGKSVLLPQFAIITPLSWVRIMPVLVLTVVLAAVPLTTSLYIGHIPKYTIGMDSTSVQE